MYGDNVSQSDIDRAVSSAKSDLDYDIRRFGEELRSEIRNLERDIEQLHNRVQGLEEREV